ncbi:Protein of unknown function [Ruminococcaceae bacterium FB2012]|nr:Protein of unknown function [Ruminococcaceae bacterium FB2012]
MWTNKSSIMLSKALTLILTAAIASGLVFIPRLTDWYCGITVGRGFIDGDLRLPMMIVLYITTVFGLAASVTLILLLGSISKGRVFTKGNTLCLRVISWACLLASAAFAVLGMWRFIFFAFAFLGAFLGIVIRVLKNVFAAAVELKEENDYTV